MTIIFGLSWAKSESAHKGAQVSTSHKWNWKEYRNLFMVFELLVGNVERAPDATGLSGSLLPDATIFVGQLCRKVNSETANLQQPK